MILRIVLFLLNLITKKESRAKLALLKLLKSSPQPVPLIHAGIEREWRVYKYSMALCRWYWRASHQCHYLARQPVNGIIISNGIRGISFRIFEKCLRLFFLKFFHSERNTAATSILRVPYLKRKQRNLFKVRWPFKVGLSVDPVQNLAATSDPFS